MPPLTDSTIQVFGNEVFMAAAAPLVAGVPEETMTPDPVEKLELVHEDFLKWLYKPHTRNLDRVFILMETLGIRRNYLLYLISMLLVYALCSSWGPLISNLIGIVYPVVLTYLDRVTDKKTDHWFIYWPIFGAFSLLDTVGYWFLFVFPTYYVVKSIFLVWLWLPQTGGTKYVYSKVVRQFVEMKVK